MRATLYDSGSSARREVDISLLPTGSLQVRDERDVRSWLLNDLQVADRIAGCPAILQLPGGEAGKAGRSRGRFVQDFGT